MAGPTALHSVRTLFRSGSSTSHTVYASLNFIPIDPSRSNNTADFHEGPGTSFGGVRDWNYPTYPTDHPNSVRCGRDNLKWAPETEVLKVKPGDTLQFQPLQIPPNQWNDTKRVQWDNCPNGQGVCDASPDVCLLRYTMSHIA